VSKLIRTHRDLDVYQKAFDASMELFHTSRTFPREEQYALTDQLRRSSRSVCAHIAEAWRKRRYEKSFVSKLSDADGEGAEVQVWLEYAVECGYVGPETARPWYKTYNEVQAMLVAMMNDPRKWFLSPAAPKE